MSKNELEHLAYMANQIASNISIGESEELSANNVANHIKLFWARPMREKLCKNINNPELNLNSTTKKAMKDICKSL